MKKFTHRELGYPFKSLPSVTGEDGSRYYSIPNGDKYPSVTTVTGYEKKEFFAEWRKNNPKESKRCLRRGNNLHDSIEKYLKNDPDYLNPFAPPMEHILFDQMKPELHKIDNIVAQEVPLYSSLLGLAGRVDCIAEYNGKTAIIDFKGSTREKRESDIDNYFMQVTAYAIMFQELTGISVDDVVVLISSEDGTVQSFVDNPIRYTKKLYNCIKSYKSIQTNDFSSVSSS